MADVWRDVDIVETSDDETDDGSGPGVLAAPLGLASGSQGRESLLKACMISW